MRLSVITSCEGCGVCCMREISPPYMDEIDLIPRALQDEVNQHRAAMELLGGGAGPCLWFDMATKRCTHYDDRPNVCREFELNGEECHDVRRAFGVDDPS